MRLLIVIPLHQLRQQTHRMDQLTFEHPRPVLLSWTYLLLVGLCEHDMIFIFAQLKTADDHSVVKMEEFSDLIDELSSFEVDLCAGRNLHFLQTKARIAQLLRHLKVKATYRTVICHIEHSC